MQGKPLSIKVLSFIERKVRLVSNYPFSFRVAVHYHLLNLSWRHLLPQFLSCSHQVFLAYKTFSILVEVLKYSLDILISIVLIWLLSHHFHEFSKRDLTSIIGIEIAHGHIDKGSTGLIASVITDGLS